MVRTVRVSESCRRTLADVTCGRSLRHDRRRELQIIIRRLSPLTAQRDSHQNYSHDAQRKTLHGLLSFRVEIHILRAQASANMTATPGQAISITISTRGVSAAHCIHPSTTSANRRKKRPMRQPRCLVFRESLV
jgi:hypothetical protein